MASGGRDDKCFKNDAASSQPLREEETTAAATAKRLRFTPTLAPTTLQPPSPNSPSIPGNSLHAPPPAAIPFDLIAEILARLPVKSLLRFRCVCRSWNALISDPKFARKQLQASSTRSTRHHLIVTFLLPLTRVASRRLLPPLRTQHLERHFLAAQGKCPCDERRCFKFLAGSCHGMLCVPFERSRPLLWNPSTGKFKTLPSLKFHWQEPNCMAYGFGYDHFSDSYKVVVAVVHLRAAGGNRVFGTDVKVHTLGTDSWRAIQGFPATVAFDDSGKFVSGTLNWLAKDITPTKWVIASHDLGTETYRPLLPPDCRAHVKLTLTSTVLRGCLSVLAHCNMVSDVWLMKEYGNRESWTKLFSVPYLGVHPEYHDYHPYYKRALYVSEEDDEILLEYESNLVIYNFKSGTFKTNMIQKLRAPIVAEVYAESLISPCY